VDSRRSAARRTDRIDAARERLARTIFQSWDAQEIDDLVRLMRKFAETAKQGPRQEL
jgi:erythromycin esterase-like protein